jgi:hypothetical protein
MRDAEVLAARLAMSKMALAATIRYRRHATATHEGRGGGMCHASALGTVFRYPSRLMTATQAYQTLTYARFTAIWRAAQTHA